MEDPYAVQRIITDIKNDDILIQITGHIKDIVEDDNIILTDGTGDIKVNLQKMDYDFKMNDLINVIGELNYSVKGLKSVDAHIVQDMKNLNFKYYRKLYELKKEFL